MNAIVYNGFLSVPDVDASATTRLLILTVHIGRYRLPRATLGNRVRWNIPAA